MALWTTVVKGVLWGLALALSALLAFVFTTNYLNATACDVPLLWAVLAWAAWLCAFTLLVILRACISPPIWSFCTMFMLGSLIALMVLTHIWLFSSKTCKQTSASYQLSVVGSLFNVAANWTVLVDVAAGLIILLSLVMLCAYYDDTRFCCCLFWFKNSLDETRYRLHTEYDDRTDAPSRKDYKGV